MLDITQFDEIAKKEAYPVVLDDYDAGGPPVYEQICEVIDGIDPVDISLQGTKGTTMTTMGRPKRRKPGQAIEEDRPGEGYTWQMRFDQLTQHLAVPYETVAALDSKVGDFIAGQIRSWGAAFAAEEEEFVAGMFMKGTLTAGSLDYFDGSFVSNADANAKFIYDGLPFFDGAHTQAAGGNTFSNISTSLTLSQANLQTVYTTVSDTNAKNERNENISIMPDVLVVAPGQKFLAEVITQTAQVTASANNDINPSAGLVRPIVWRYLTDDATQWIVGKAGSGIQVRRTPLRIVTWDDPKTQSYHVAALREFGGAVTNWRHWYSCDKADS